MDTPVDTQPEAPGSTDRIERFIQPERTDLGGFSVRRALPAAAQRMVGPFIFFDHIGPAEFPPGEGIQVRPHPHIGLATVTYLFEGEIIHRDNLGYLQPIEPGAVNLMTAGKGIVHSERAREGVPSRTRLHGIQCWMALPDAEQECEPAFEHYAADAIPRFNQGEATGRVIIGDAFGHRSPVGAKSEMLYLEAHVPADATLSVPDTVTERAVYVVSGAVDIAAQRCDEGVMAVLRPGAEVALRALQQTRVVIIGGAPVGPRHIWWNFVSNSKARIEQAKDDWRQDRFARIPGETEFIPLPDR